ncbi:MAG TPA: TniB family NTP-binding protein [Rhodocyclaceae bacterium]
MDCTDEDAMETARERDERLSKLDREAVLSLSGDDRLHWFSLLQVKHREMERIVEDFSHLLHPDIEATIVAMIGMTGIGKTTLARRILHAALLKVWREKVGPTDVPYIFIEAPANGERSFSWKTLYQRALKAGNEILISQKRQICLVEDRLISLSGKSTVGALRESLEELLKQRQVRVLVIDEAVHTLRFEEYAAVMDTLKSLANACQTKIVLIGSYDLFDLVTDHGQVMRRGEILHYKRYKSNIAADKTEFLDTVVKLQKKWPCKIIPNLAAISEELMEVTFGSVGLLKALMLSALAAQIKSKGEKWDPKYLRKAAKSVKLFQKIREETLVGEEKLAGATFGESLFDDEDYFAAVLTKMGGAG